MEPKKKITAKITETLFLIPKKITCSIILKNQNKENPIKSILPRFVWANSGVWKKET
jgi:hypothetical protein